MYTIPEITASEVALQRSLHTLVDVREPKELVGPEGQIDGVILASLGEGLARFLTAADPSESYIFICRSGKRSAHACTIAHTYGFHKVYNMTGGMIAWNQHVKALKICFGI